MSAWRRIRWSMYQPLYDAGVARVTAPARRRSLQLLSARADERVLLSGCGTGLDLRELPVTAQVVGFDVSPRMVARARRRASCLGMTRARLEVGDAERLPLHDESVDAAVLHLVLAIVERPEAALAEVQRVLRPGGRAVVFDKFVPGDGEASLARRAVGAPVKLFFTDITRRLDALVAGSALELLHEEPSLLRGQFRIALLRKP